MYPAAALLKDCQRLVKELEKDIRARAEADPVVVAQYAKARDQKKTSVVFGAWLSEQVTQAAVAWVLASVFVRFLEDNRLIDQAWISGPDDADQTKSQLKQAVLNREAYLNERPQDNDAQYLQHVFKFIGQLPACRDLFAADRNPLYRLSVSGDGGKLIIAFWREQDRDGAVIRTLATDALADTRWLGDLYQDLSADARKRFALLQTPDFVEEFILDYTLTPAIQTFGLEGLRGIDPTCGSGHFLLGMFHRLWHAWERQLGPGVPVKEAVRRAMGSIYGIDVNPFAVAISRFRLMIAGLVACGYTRMKDCPEWGFTLAVGNTLTLGSESGIGFETTIGGEHQSEVGNFLVPGDYAKAKEVLTKSYQVVVGNPPYIAVKDANEREAIKGRYRSCFKKWTLSVPFTERFFNLAQDNLVDGKVGSRLAGFVGLINSNNFTKREFGKALIEQVLPNLDLTHVIDTSACYIPGHTTSTVILFGRNQRPSAQRPVRAVQGIRGERGRPENPAQAKVWMALVDNIGNPGAETPWLSVADVDRKVFGLHPWSLGGGGVGELKALIEQQVKTAGQIFSEAGFFGFSAADEILAQRTSDYRRQRFEPESFQQLVAGDDVREWRVKDQDASFFPYVDGVSLTKPELIPQAMRALWGFRTSLWNRPTFGGKTYKTEGLAWWRWHQVALSRLKPPLTITFAEVAPNNHFVLCRGGVVFKQTAPVIKLSAEATEDDHLALLACLNSSTVAFWLMQVCTCKGDGAKGLEPDPYMRSFAFNSTNIEKTPISDDFRPERIALTRRLDALGQELAALQPSRLFAAQVPTRQLLDQTAARVAAIRAEMIFLQEELDWLLYRAYGILTEAECPLYAAGTVPLALGERAFEIDLARKVAAEEEETSWFERHRSTPITDMPTQWPVKYQRVVQQRLDLIASHPHIGLLEKPEYKRRWQSDPWDEVVHRGLRDWLCDQLENRRWWPEQHDPQLISTTTLAERIFADPTFTQVAALYCGNDHFDRHQLILDLVTEESVPALPVWRYTEEGLRKRAGWEETWVLQRREDAGEHVDIPVPERYTPKDFQKPSYWSHRGKLDVPKERFINYPGCQSDGDPGLLILWAGYDHLQHTKALIAHYQWAKDEAGWTSDRLIPLLVSLDQVVPWLKQWHNDMNPAFNVRLGDYYAEFLVAECEAMNLSVKVLRAWKPTTTSREPAPQAQAAASNGGDAPKKRGRPRKSPA